MKKKILFFGDSLTYGSNPNLFTLEKQGFSFVDILKDKFSGLDIVKEGQGGRTVLNDDGREGRNGYKMFQSILYSNFHFDYIFIMLGTNDLKNRFNLNAKEIAEQFTKYAEFIKHIQEDVYFDYKNTIVVLIVPPKIKADWIPESWKEYGEWNQKKSNSLKAEYVKIADQLNWDLIDASGVKISKLDGVHLDEIGNKSLARIIEKYFEDSILGKGYTYGFDDWNHIKNFSTNRIIGKFGSCLDEEKREIKKSLRKLLGFF